MKYQVLFIFSEKQWKKYLRMSSAAVVIGTLRVKIIGPIVLYYQLEFCNLVVSIIIISSRIFCFILSNLAFYYMPFSSSSPINNKMFILHTIQHFVSIT